MNNLRGGLIFLLLACLVLTTISAYSGTEVSTMLIKSSLYSGGNDSKTFNIESELGGDFSIEVDSLNGVSVDEDGVFVLANEKMAIEVGFDSAGLDLGTYVGTIKITGPSDSMMIPVILEVESDIVLFDVNLDIPPAYSSIEQGEKLIYQTKIFDLTASGGLQEGLGSVSVNVEHTVYDLKGSILLTQSEQQIVNKQSQITNTIDFPQGFVSGVYVLSTIVNYKNSSGISSQTFEIIPKSEEIKFNFENADYTLIIILGAGLFLFLLIIFLFVYLIRERDKILSELRKYNSKESREVYRLLSEQKKLAKQKGKDIWKTEKEAERKIKSLKAKQEQRIKSFKTLKKAGATEEMKQKLKEWKSKGYNTLAMEYKMKDLTKSEMKSILERWRKKYATNK